MEAEIKETTAVFAKATIKKNPFYHAIKGISKYFN